MILTHYRKTFLIRFWGYFFIQAGLITLMLIIEPVITEEVKYRVNDLAGRHFILPQIVTSTGTETISTSPPEDKPEDKPKMGLGSLLTGGTEIITPISTDFGIVIEKIGANAKVVANVDSGNEKNYTKALGQGVAHAKGTVYPGQVGNIYLFSHSVGASWEIVRFNAIFYLLSKLEKGDKVIMFYQGRRFDYIVFDKTVASPSDTRFLTDSYNESILTLQTCDPPGTLLNRLIIRARLASG